MKKEEFIKEVFDARKMVRNHSLEVNEIISKEIAYMIAIEAVKQDIEYKNSLPVISRGIERVDRDGRN